MNVTSEAELVKPPARSVPPALVALLAPDTGMARQGRVGGWKFAFFTAMACALLAAGAEARRLSAKDATLQKMEQQGQLKNMSDRQIEDETKGAETKAKVLGVAAGVFEAPFQLLGVCLALVAMSFLLNGRLKGAEVVPVAAATLLPNAIANLLGAIAAWQHAVLEPGHPPLVARTLSLMAVSLGHPLAGTAATLGNAVDFFYLWAAVLFGYGLAEVGQMPRRRALVGGVLFGVCVLLVWRVVLGKGG